MLNMFFSSSQIMASADAKTECLYQDSSFRKRRFPCASKCFYSWRRSRGKYIEQHFSLFKSLLITQ